MAQRLALLIADDESIIRRKLVMMLGRRFHIDEVETAEAVRSADISRYDAVLLDIVFPDGNGIDLCREIRDARPHTTIIVTSSLESVDAWNQAFQAGADNFMEKRELLGLDPRKVILMVENLVERNRLRALAEETSERRNELLSVLSHDVRAPFQALLGTIELLRKSPIPPEALANVETLYCCARDQLNFINSLLDLLRLESGQRELRLFPADINLVVNQSVQGLGVLATKKEIRVECSLHTSIPKVNADIARIAQLMNNLLSNAIKFTPRGGDIVVSTAAASRRGLKGVEIRVQDAGVGVSPEDRTRLFQRFRLGSSPGTEGERGSGLGLSICSQIVQAHEGAIEICDAASRGALAIVWLPLTPGKDSALQGPLGPSGSSRRLDKTGRVVATKKGINHQDAETPSLGA
jgi:signal transduction histidine kinase